MQNPICLSTGSVHEFVPDFNERITKVREFKPDGVEICLARPTELLGFEITSENLKYLLGLEFVSIHAPVIDITYRNDELSRKVLAKVEKLSQQIGARNVVFHRKEMEDPQILNDYNFIASLENLDFRSPGCMQNVAEVEKELAKDNNLKLTFDFAHAFSIDPNSISSFVKEFRDKIVEFHVAFLDQDTSGRPSYHWFLYKNDSEQIRSFLKFLDNPNIPIVIESTAAEPEEMSWLGEEIEYLREI
ncbi:hypothetical protein KJ903_02580 [Patescibacteria group bacterium]|nr:hypothetical protein [Patescibacteria group bacterium]